MLDTKKKDDINHLLETGEIVQAIEKLEKFMPEDKKFLMVYIMLDIFTEEVKNNSLKTVLDYALDFDMLVQHFMRTKLYLRRFELGMPTELQYEFYSYMQETGVSDIFVLHIIEANICYKNVAYMGIANMFKEYEGEFSVSYLFYKKLALER
jgi:hypothetical protein